ncbi:MAG TPA: two-component regulator propeller domain-containing protein [Bacteroidia bacterium]|nr:two-component regulator propeller domain-containing protein [Bacteroidia bacterium]
MLRINFFLPVFFAFGSILASAQEKTIVLKHITTSEGLSDNQVTCMLRDNLGFLWIGTKDGLNRYDGRDFYVYKYNDNDSNSVCGNIISCLEIDNDSLLWIGTASSGFCSYNFRTQKFKWYNKSNSELVTDNINDIAFDKRRNCLWIAQNNAGLQIFDLKTKSTDKKQKRISTNTYYDVLVYDTIPYFAGIIESLKRLGKVGKFRTPLMDTAMTINKITLASDAHLWCGAWDNGLHQFDANAKRIATYFFDGTNKLKLSGEEIISLEEDGNKVLWCGTKSSGILFFDLKTKSFTTDIKLSTPVTSRVNNLYRDNHNRIWIATETGLFVYDPLQNQFEITRLPVPRGFNSCKVNDRIVLDGGKEFIVTNCGLFYKNSHDANYSHKDFYYRDERQELTSIFVDEQNTVYIGTNRSLFFLDTNKLELILPKVSASARKNRIFFIGASRVNSITKISHNNYPLIAASLYGHYIQLSDPAGQNTFFILKDTAVKKTYIDNLSRKILFDSKNNFWICGATHGINKVIIPPQVSFDKFPLADTIVRVIYVTSKDWISHETKEVKMVNNIYDMNENTDGSFWITTQGYGLLKFFPENDSVAFKSYANQIKSLQGLAKDKNENLWMVTSTGLLNYNVKGNRYKLFDTQSGVSENINGYFFRNDNSIPQDEMSVGFDGGFVSFHPSEIVSNKEKPVVSITRLWIMDTPSDSLLMSELKLNYTQNFLKFNIAANSFSDNGQTTYLYLLEGIDHDWRSNQTNPLITYTNLPAGNFTLKIKAINSDGVESTIYEFPVIITPPFYKTYWFYILVIITTAASIYVLYRYRIRQILKLQEVRNKIARDLHDDIGSTIGSIHLYSQIANKKLNGENSESVKTILEKIESSSGEIIEKTGDAVWAVKASNDSVKNLVLRMESYAASLLGAAGIQFNIDYDESIGDTKLEMTQRKNIFLVYKEALHNIIKYANCTDVNIEVKKNAGKLRIRISDNGKGFDTSPPTPLQKRGELGGNGIKNMKSRAEEINGTFQITSQPGQGTIIDFEV